MTCDLRLVGVLALVGTGFGCQGSIGDSTGGVGVTPGGKPGSKPGNGNPPVSCQGSLEPGRAPLRRLTRTEYSNTVRDLLNDTSNVSASFPPEEDANGFLNNADAYSTSDLHVQKYLDGAERVAATARAAGKFKLACQGDPANPANSQKCATDFIRSFGLKAFRRPLEDAEVATFYARFQMGATASFEEGLEWVVGRMLQSPYFLYRIEKDAPMVGTPYLVSAYPLATRLSYFLWQTTPDDQLLDDAGKGKLGTAEGIQAEVLRMIGDQKFADTLSSFHSQWLGLSAVVGSQKTAPSTPMWTSTLQAELLQEADLFIKDVFDTNGTLSTLLTGGKAFLNADLARFYGVQGPADSSYMAVPTLANRHGILTLPAMLAGLSHADQSAPVKRGKMIREQLLCTPIPDPPPDLKIEVPTVQPGKTTRERFEAHRTQPTCATCHTLMDPLAMPLEYYDEFGRYRTTDQGKPVDGAGELTETSAVDKTVSTPAELGTKLAQLPEVQNCMVSQWFRFSAGHVEEQTDTCSLNALMERFGKSGQNMRDLLVSIATGTSFRYRVDH